MTKFIASVLLVPLGIALCIPPVARAAAGSAQTPAPRNSDKTMKAYQKKQQKQMKKTLKAQKKAQKKLQKLHPTGH